LLAERLYAASVKERKGVAGRCTVSAQRPTFCGRVCFYGVGSANVPPKISLLPKVEGQSCWAAGAGTGVPARSDVRPAATAGQLGRPVPSIWRGAVQVRPPLVEVDSRTGSWLRPNLPSTQLSTI